MSDRGIGSDQPPILAIYADESCLGNGRVGENPGGAGGLIEVMMSELPEPRRWDYWLSEPSTTNNRMALRSVIEGFRLVSRKGRQFRIVFTTDSRYLVDGMNEWVHRWIRQGWRRKEGPVENLELWQDAVEQARCHPRQWRWVRGHNGHAQNEYVNFLATRAAREQSSSNGVQDSQFQTWLAAERQRGHAHADPDPFPRASDFTPSRPFPP